MAEATKETTKPVVKKAAKKVEDFAKTPIPKEDWDETLSFAMEKIHEAENLVTDIPQRLTTRQLVIVSGVVVVGVAVGGYVGYRVAEKRLSTKFEAIMEEETEKLKEHYDAKAEALKAQNKPDLVDRAAVHRQREEADQLIAQNGYADTPADVAALAREQQAIRETNERTDVNDPADIVVVEPTVVNIFDERDKAEAETEAWDYAKEIKSRNPLKPYVVHIAEFHENSAEYDTADLTYYEGDGILANDRDQAINDAEEMVGVANLELFGHGSDDPNLVFIRNDVREMLYEVSRSHGKYSVEVHGIDDTVDLQHSDERRFRRRKFDDD